MEASGHALKRFRPTSSSSGFSDTQMCQVGLQRPQRQIVVMQQQLKQ